MPIADLLGVSIDMQLLAKLTVSAAAILFVTWVFRVYSSRARDQARAKKKLPPPGSTQPISENCNPCKTVLGPLKEEEQRENEEENRFRQSSVDFGQGIHQVQKDAMVKKDENKTGEDVVTNTERRFFLFFDVDSNVEGSKTSEDSVTNTEASSSSTSGVKHNAEVNTRSEDAVTNTERRYFLFFDVDSNVEESKTSEDSVTNTEASSLSTSGVERNAEVNTRSEDVVTNTERRFFLFFDGDSNIEASKAFEDSVTNTEASSSSTSGVERNTEVNTRSENAVTNTLRRHFLFFDVDSNVEGSKTSEDSVTNTEASSSSTSGVEHNTKVNTRSKDDVTNTERRFFPFSDGDSNVEGSKTSEDSVTNTEESSSLASGVERNTEISTKSEDCLTHTEGTSSPSSFLERNMEGIWDKAESELKECKTGLTLPIPGLDVKAATTPTGRRSPCQLKKLDGGVEVGRELRQNMGHPGTFSSFQSKAEIKVENANLVIEGPGDKNTAVRGKIYDYFVETSSQSISELSPTSSISPTYAPYEGNNLSNVVDKPRTPSPLPSSLIIRDLEFSNDSDRGSQPPVRSETGRHLRHGLIRKDSYLAAASESELHIPFPAPVTRSRSPALLNEHSTHSPVSPKELQEFGWKPSEDPQVETVARAQFFHIPIENIGNSDLESLTGKLDLGNCLEALMLAKKHGHYALQQAALRVMSDNYFQVLRDPNLYGRLKAGERDQIQRLRKRGRRFLMIADMESPDWTRSSLQSYPVKASSGLYYYDDYKDTWHLQCPIPQEVFSKGCAICTMDNYLFVAVGFQRTVPSNKVFCYNPMTSIWSEICPMNEARPHCKLVALQDHVYAIGGECLSTVERYDPRTNRWTFVAPLPNDTFAVAHRATACNGELFVSGGTLKYTLLRYNPKNDVWRQSLIVGSKERTREMIAVRNFLYRFDVNPYIGISVYRYHVVARLWYQCCSKKIPNCPVLQCVAMDDIIYCVSRQFTMRFLADEKSPGFVADDLQILTAAKGILFPFVLALPDKSTLQTSV